MMSKMIHLKNEDHRRKNDRKRKSTTNVSMSSLMRQCMASSSSSFVSLFSLSFPSLLPQSWPPTQLKPVMTVSITECYKHCALLVPSATHTLIVGWPSVQCLLSECVQCYRLNQTNSTSSIKSSLCCSPPINSNWSSIALLSNWAVVVTTAITTITSHSAPLLLLTFAFLSLSEAIFLFSLLLSALLFVTAVLSYFLLLFKKRSC